MFRICSTHALTMKILLRYVVKRTTLRWNSNLAFKEKRPIQGLHMSAFEAGILSLVCDKDKSESLA